MEPVAIIYLVLATGAFTPRCSMYRLTHVVARLFPPSLSRYMCEGIVVSHDLD
jgi:hypothetical protein